MSEPSLETLLDRAARLLVESLAANEYPYGRDEEKYNKLKEKTLELLDEIHVLFTILKM